MTIKRLLMLNGTWFMKNWPRSSQVEPRSSSPSYLLVIWQLNILLIEDYSVLEEYLLKTWIELLRLLVELFKLLLMDWMKMFWEHVRYSKKFNWEMKDSIYSENVLRQSLVLLYLEEVLINTLMKLKDHWMMPLWLSEEQLKHTQ